MNGMELIRGRRSVRTFESGPLRVEDAQAILSFAASLDNPYDIPIRWRLLDAKKSGLSVPVIVGAETYIAGAVRRVPHAEEAFGYAFEKLVLYALSRGIGTTWIAGTMDRPAFERAMELTVDEAMPCVSPLGYPAARMSLRETMMRKGVRADSRLPFEELFFDGVFGAPLTQGKAGEAAQALSMVRLAPSAVNRQPWRVVLRDHAACFYEKRSKGYVDGRGWDLQKVDLGIALYHFACGLECQGISPRLSMQDPGLDLPQDTAFIAAWEW